MRFLSKYLFFLLLTACSLGASAQILEEDTTTNEPFFKASKFNSKFYAGFEGAATQMLKKDIAFNSGFSLNWVINHKYVLSAKYYALTTDLNVTPIVAPDQPAGTTINLTHQFAGLGFSYILFDDKKFSFQPELTGGWGMIKYTLSSVNFHDNFGEVIPAVYGTYNVSKYFRFGLGLNYRLAIGTSLNGLKSSDISGVSGLVFIKVGTF